MAHLQAMLDCPQPAIGLRQFVAGGGTLLDLAPVPMLGRTETSALASDPQRGIFLLIAACGKSAQFPLHVWLPDSMEGPTPISALIHAATMVTAGVFLVCRMSPLMEYATEARTFIVIIGANPTVNHPVAATFIKNAVKERGAKLIIMDPRGQNLARFRLPAFDAARPEAQPDAE